LDWTLYIYQIFTLVTKKLLLMKGSWLKLYLTTLKNTEDGTLYCNVYLRALEVSKFLRINLEEIRLNIEKISQSTLSFSKVRLVILACRAHHVPNFNPLEKPKLDLMSQYQILKMMNDNRAEFIRYIEQMAEVQTVLTSKSIQLILELVEGEWKGGNKLRLESVLRDTIAQIDELVVLRKQHSHHERLRLLGASISDKFRVLVEEISK
jgi:hypothetical protein